MLKYLDLVEGRNFVFVEDDEQALRKLVESEAEGVISTKEIKLIPCQSLLIQEKGRTFFDYVLPRKWDVVQDIACDLTDAKVSLSVGGHELSQVEGAILPLAALTYSEVSIRVTLPSYWKRKNDDAAIPLRFTAILLHSEIRKEMMHCPQLQLPTFRCANGVFVPTSSKSCSPTSQEEVVKSLSER